MSINKNQVSQVKEKNLLVFYDNWCPLCSKTMQVYNRLDWFGWISFMPCREESLLEQYNIDQQQAIIRMMAIRYKKKKRVTEANRVITPIQYEGIDTIIQMSARIPILWPVVPILWSFRKVGLGTWVYDWIASKRRIIPIRQCETDVCLIENDTN